MYKLILFFCCLFLCLAQVSVSQKMPRLTIEFEAQSIYSALRELDKTSDFRFLFQDEVPDTLMVTNQKIEDKTLFQILDALLVDSGFSFAVVNNHFVVIYRLQEAIQSQDSTPITVKGRVIEFNVSIPGARVFIKPDYFCLLCRNSHAVYSLRTRILGSLTLGNLVAITEGEEGFFEFTVRNPNTYLIVISPCGANSMLPRVVHINDAELIVLEMDEDNERFNEVVITGDI